MPADIFERLDALSQESREKLNEQIERVQEEARRLRAQARRLRRAQQAETKHRKKLLSQVAYSSKDWGQSALQRGGDLTSAAGSQLKAGQQALLDRSGELAEGVGRRGSQLTHNVADWGDETAHRLRKQGQHLTENVLDWGDETTHRLRKQGQNLAENVVDWRDETTHELRKRGRKMAKKLAKQKEKTVRQLRKQSHNLGRDLAERREDATRKLRKQGRSLSKNLSERKDQLLNNQPRGGSSKFWSVLGFIAGLLLAGGVTYWLVRRNFTQSDQTEEQIELQRGTLNGNGAGNRPAGEIRYTSQGGTAVATRPSVTDVEQANKYVGVLSTHQYYPIEQRPDANDLVFFTSEDDARAEGFTASE
jgi:DNA repair exonuclease SbcCD ATPase subunit